jgi:hypothetical protein
VYRHNDDWSNPVQLFDAGNGTVGITYDPNNNSLWISNLLTGVIQNYSFAGDLLSSFPTGVLSGRGLAMDYADDTLWLSNGDDLVQLSTTGSHLDTVYGVGGLAQGLEAQFPGANVPDSGATLALFGLALAGLGFGRRFFG